MLRSLTAAASILLVGACGADGVELLPAGDTPRRPSDSAAPASCEITEVARKYLRLADGDYVYVEPQHFARGADGWVVAGQPTYRVRIDRAGSGGMTEPGAWFGVTFADAEARPIPNPPVGARERIVWSRGAPARGRGRSGFVYEVADGTRGQGSASLLPAGSESASRIVFAEYDPVARTWDRPVELPAPPEGRLRSLDAVAGPVEVQGSPGAVRRRGSSGAHVLAVPHELPRGGVDVLLYTRAGRGWTSTRVWRRWIDAIAIAAVPGRPAVLALAGLDPDADARRASVRTLPLHDPQGFDPAASPRRYQEGRAGERFVSPAFARAADRLDLGWLRRTPGAPTSAWVMPGVEGGPEPARGRAGGPYLIDAVAAQIVPVDGADGVSLWLTAQAPSPENGSRALIVATLVGPSGAVEGGRVPNPFHGPFAAVRASSTDVLVVGPEARFDPVSPFVRSLVIRLSIRCTP